MLPSLPTVAPSSPDGPQMAPMWRKLPADDPTWLHRFPPRMRRSRNNSTATPLFYLFYRPRPSWSRGYHRARAGSSGCLTGPRTDLVVCFPAQYTKPRGRDSWSARPLTFPSSRPPPFSLYSLLAHNLNFLWHVGTELGDPNT